MKTNIIRGTSLWNNITLVILLTLIIVYVVRAYIFFPVIVEGNSMDNTLLTGEKYIVNKLSKPKRNDIVVFIPPTKEDSMYIKRVIATGGDTIKVEKDVLYINGKKVEEDYLTDHKRTLDIGMKMTEDIEEMTIKEGYYYVMGDNRFNSEDSRTFGQIEEERIQGVVIKRD